MKVADDQASDRPGKYLVIADEDGAQLGSIPDTVVRTRPSLTLAQLTDEMRVDKYLCKDFDKLIIHAGAADIVHGASEKQVLRTIRRLCELVRDINPKLELFISSILPRPGATRSFIELAKTVNYQLAGICAKFHAAFLPSFKPFLCKGRPKLQNYIEGQLSRAGAFSLTQCFRHALSPRNAGILVAYARREASFRR